MNLQTPEKIRTLQRKLYFAAKEKPERRFHQLYDQVYRPDILLHAYRLSKSLGGAAGADGQTFADIESAGRAEWLEGLREELRAQTYRPSPVRRVMIPKPNGGERPLGIPTIRDRVAQAAAKLVIEPIFEADFEDCAYGYRPKRGARDAVEKVHEGLLAGYTDVVDADLSKFFDTIPHDQLMQSVARRIVDRRMLALIKAWLSVSVVMTDDRGRKRVEPGGRRGTPQGGVISPLLANIYMHRYLRHWRERGCGERFQARIVNYADDFVILSRGRAEEALSWTRKVMQAIGLELNETKTRLCNAREASFDFLGYSFGPHIYRRTGRTYTAAWPSKKSVTRLKESVARILGPRVDPWGAVRDQLNRTLRGWLNYFNYGTTARTCWILDNYVYKRVLGFLRRRHKVSTRGTRVFPAEVVYGRLGVHPPWHRPWLVAPCAGR